MMSRQPLIPGQGAIERAAILFQFQAQADSADIVPVK